MRFKTVDCTTRWLRMGVGRTCEVVVASPDAAIHASASRSTTAGVARTGRVAVFNGAAVLALVAASGCSQLPVPAAQTVRLYHVDLQGAAANCKVSSVAAQPGKQVPVDMAVANDGGWCALSIGVGNDTPYDAGLLSERPQHGTAYIHTVGNATRIDYTPVRGYAGPDKFVTTLLPGGATLAFNVTVAPR